MAGGEHWIIDVEGAAPAALAGASGRAALAALLADVVDALALHPLGAPALHTFDDAQGAPGAGGTTALLALTESHLAAHGFPEEGALSLDLYTCRPRPAPDWQALVRRRLGPCEVTVRRLERGASVALPGEGTA